MAAARTGGVQREHGQAPSWLRLRPHRDDPTRLAYSEILPDEKDPTCAAFLHRALAWFAARGIPVRRLLIDNAIVYRRGTDWGWVCSAWQLKRRFTKPGCPWIDGKAERFNRTLLNEWAYTRTWTNNRSRTQRP